MAGKSSREEARFHPLSAAEVGGANRPEPPQQVAKVGEEEEEREVWGKGFEFVLACVGYAVGLGNIWRFPYLCYKNGGGAFLVPYFVFVACAGGPLLFLEVGLGQFMSQGNISAWNICPIFKGIGIGSTLMVVYCTIYYIVVMAWAIHYLGASIMSLFSDDGRLPWSTCDNWWNGRGCVSVAANDTSRVELDDGVSQHTDSALEYWENKVLMRSDGLYDVGGMQWELVASLAVAWLLVYACVFKGVQSSGKVVYVTATAPFLMLAVLLVRGVTLPGAAAGLEYYMRPRMEKLLDSRVWIDAGTQVLYSFACTFGGMVSLGSYNKFHRDFVRDCTFICGLNAFGSLFGGTVIFSVLGYMSHVSGIPIEKVADSGPGLAFIVYPKAVSLMPFPRLWALLFFIMLNLVAVDSVFVMVEAIITAIMDVAPALRRLPSARELFSALACLIMFVLGLAFVTQGGAYVFQIFDYYVANGMVLLTYCFTEAVAIAWVYGVTKWYDDIESMIGRRLNRWLMLCWAVLTPAITFGLLIVSVVNYKPLKYDSEYEIPLGGQLLGLAVGFTHVVFVPLYFLWALLVAPGVKIAEKWRSATAPQMEETLRLRQQQKTYRARQMAAAAEEGQEMMLK